MGNRLLMIDDNREMVNIARLILERQGFEILAAYSGAEGLAILDKEGDQIDLILLDIMMFGMDGWQVLETIKKSEQHAHIPVVMLTSLPPHEAEIAIAKHAAMLNGYIVKPFVISKLVNTIKQLVISPGDNPAAT